MKSKCLFLIFFICIVPLRNFAQIGFTVLEVCEHLVDGVDLTADRRSLITTDTGAFYVDENIPYPGNNWVLVGYYPVVFENSIPSFDTSGHLIASLYQLSDSGQWRNVRRTLYSWNAGNEMTDSLTQIDSSGIWVNQNFQSWHYNSFSLLDFAEEKIWDGSQWENFKRVESYYDLQGRDTLSYHFSGSGSSWVYTTLSRKVYQGNDLVDAIQQTWDGTSWLNNSRQQDFFSFPGADSLTIRYQGNLQAWDSLTLIRRTFDPDSNMALSETFNYDSAQWIPQVQVFYTYDNQHRMTEVISQQRADTIWINSNLTTYQYDDSTHTVYKYDESWADTIWNCFSFSLSTTYSPLQFRFAEYTCSSCSDCQIVSDRTETYDTLGRLIVYSVDNHDGNSYLYGRNDYDSTGFLFHTLYISSTMHGSTNETNCWYYHPLICSFIDHEISACGNDSLRLEAKVSGGVPPYTFHWINNTSGISDTSSSNPWLLTQQNDQWYSFMVSDSLGNYFTDSIWVNIEPDLTLGSDSVVCDFASVVLSPGSFDSYLWQDGSIDSVYIAQSLVSGTDTLICWVEVGNASGCTNRDSITVYFEACLNVLPVSKNWEFNLSPNPAHRGEFVRFSGTQSFSVIKLYTSSGAMSCQSTSNQGLIIPENSNPGIYMLVAIGKDGTIASRRLVVY